MSAPGKLPRWAELGLLPVINLVVALLISGVVIKLLGESPVAAFKLMAAGSVGTQEGIGYTLYYATNFIFTGLAVAVAYHAGLFNIGAEGQAYIGGLGTGLVCLWLGAWPFWAVLPLAVLAGAGFGAAWAFIPAYLQAKRGSHIVITTIMFNFIAASLMTYLLVNVLIKPGQQSPESREFAVNAWMPSATDVLARVGVSFAATPLNLAFGFALGAAVLFGALYQGGSQLSFDMPKINRDMVVVIQGLVILLCGAMENVFKAPLAALFAKFGAKLGVG